MRIIPLEIGRLASDGRFLIGTEGWIDQPVPSWLIEHPDGLALFDTGLHIDLQHSVDRLGASAAVFRPIFEAGQELSARLTGTGVRPSDITHVIFSHLHFDHAGGTAEIPDARIVIQRAEWESAHRPKLIEAGIYNPDDYDHGHEVQQVDGMHDVFGDGRVICVPTPGHTVGHQALRVELESGPIVLTGDCVYFGDWLDEMRVPAFGYDSDMQLESMTALKQLRDNDGCRLLFGHDDAQFQALPDALT
jgi:N-acyl homoserine lactone hydrolase